MNTDNVQIMYTFENNSKHVSMLSLLHVLGNFNTTKNQLGASFVIHLQPCDDFSCTFDKKVKKNENEIELRKENYVHLPSSLCMPE